VIAHYLIKGFVVVVDTFSIVLISVAMCNSFLPPPVMPLNWDTLGYELFHVKFFLLNPVVED